MAREKFRSSHLSATLGLQQLDSQRIASASEQNPIAISPEDLAGPALR